MSLAKIVVHFFFLNWKSVCNFEQSLSFYLHSHRPLLSPSASRSSLVNGSNSFALLKAQWYCTGVENSKIKIRSYLVEGKKCQFHLNRAHSARVQCSLVAMQTIRPIWIFCRLLSLPIHKFRLLIDFRL